MELFLALVPPVVDALRLATQEQGQILISDNGLRFLGAGLAMGLGSLGPGLAIGNLASRALEALGRNPEAQPAIVTNMILGLAFAEAIGIYALVTAVMIGFVF